MIGACIFLIGNCIATICYDSYLVKRSLKREQEMHDFNERCDDMATKVHNDMQSHYAEMLKKHLESIEEDS